MRYIYILLIAVFVSSCNLMVPPEQQNFNDSITALGTAYVYDIDAIPEIKLEITTEQWNKLLLDFDKNPNNEEYVKSDFSFSKDKNTITLQNVGIHIRGNTSRRRPEGTKGELHDPKNPDWHHASFSVNLKKFNNKNRLAGAEKINLKWFKDDAAYVREIYCYDLFERFGVWTAPQSSYCRLSIKLKEDATTAYFGVYEMVEPVDEEFIKNRKTKFADTKGNLWKAAYGADLKNADKSRMGLENVTLEQTYTPVYDLKSNELQLENAKTQLVDFITNLNNKTGDDFKNWISAKMDVDLFLKTYAVSVMCGMWDDYWVNQNNYYFYFDSAGKFYFIPYDYDNTLGTSLIISDAGKQDVLNWGSSSRPLVRKIIAIPEYKALYIQYIKDLCKSENDLFHMNRSMNRIINWQNRISGFVNNDTDEDTEIMDKPASWGNCGYYRLLNSSNNYFKIRAANIPN